MHVLLVSTPIGFLGSGQGGGVEQILTNIAVALQTRGHHVTVLAPKGSTLERIDMLTIAGQGQSLAQDLSRSAEITMPVSSVLAAMWDSVRQLQDQFQVVVNFAYDWLPFYLSPFLQIPVAHLVSMSSLTDAVDAAIAQTAAWQPKSLAFLTRTQAQTFPLGNLASSLPCLYSGLDLNLYRFQPEAQPHLGWVARLTPEKGLADAVQVAQQTQRPLKIWGFMQDEAYWQAIQAQYPDAPVEYAGFLETQDLQAALGACSALLMTPHWVEAMGNVALEALACGVPVIAYKRGGPAEVVQDGETGWLVEPDDISGLIAAVAKIDRLDRQKCRQVAESLYSVEAMGDRVEQWLTQVIEARAAH
ncbi:MAG: glycosyltransferase family 4 protein [Cyanobacteria bacterium P01_H01_bin.121]